MSSSVKDLMGAAMKQGYLVASDNLKREAFINASKRFHLNPNDWIYLAARSSGASIPEAKAFEAGWLAANGHGPGGCFPTEMQSGF